VSSPARSSTVGIVNLATAGHGARARLAPWPLEPDVGHLVLVDHEMIPTTEEVQSWLADARARGLRAVRTGALFPESTPAFLHAGFVPADRLVLLRLELADVPRRRGRHRLRTRRLGSGRLDEAATVDQRAFAAGPDLRHGPGSGPDPGSDPVSHRSRWSNDADSLAAIGDATPHHRSRIVIRGGRVVAFAISGRAGRRGYLQRLAVDPEVQRQGLGRALVDDSLAWLRRNRVAWVLVNTELDNEPAIALYESAGFVRQPGELSVLEHALHP
jgi:ribosomal protein S18 acetylase RimI-like enzyme